jgi:signal transduction histidine kinase
MEKTEKFDFNARRAKLICGVMIFILMFIGYNLWGAFQQKKREGLSQLHAIVSHLVKRMPAESFVQIIERHGIADQPVAEQVKIINSEIQPILDNVLITQPTMKFGVYSRYHQHNVAVGPQFDHSLLVGINEQMFATMYETGLPQHGENRQSVTWYGAPVLFYRMPVSVDGKIVGHVFANINLNSFYAEFWQRTLTALGNGAVILLAVIVLFQDAYSRLRKELGLFAQAITRGKAKQFESNISELTPVLQYISEQTEHMARLDRLNVIGEMAASIGHEVRNPMTTVRGYLQHMSIKEKYKDNREVFELMMEELDRANSIITEFLSLAQNKTMDFKAVSINKVISDVAPLIQADALRMNCGINIRGEGTPAIIIDENSIRQVLLNLVRNALEAMPQGGIVTIGTSFCQDNVVLSVADEGPGIRTEVLEKLGTPFVTTKEKGTGLGLAVCYRVAQRHGATIAVESEPGKGTVFKISFSMVGKERPGTGAEYGG